MNCLVKVDGSQAYQDLVSLSDSTSQAGIDRKTDFYKAWMIRELQRAEVENQAAVLVVQTLQ